MLRKIALLCTLFFCVSVFASTQAPVFTSHKKPIVVTQKNPEFNIILKSNPSTGFSWSVLKHDHFIIALVGHKYVAPKNTKLLGAPGYDVWTFKAVYPTTYKFSVNQVGHVVMQYARGSSKTDATTKSFMVILKK